MKKIFLIIFLSIIGFSSNAQDLIVTISGDSLNVKITRITKLFIYYSYSSNGEIRNTLLQKEAVKYYAYNFYTPAGSSNNPKRLLDDWRLSFQGGLSFRVAETDPKLPQFIKEYLNELKSGHHFGFDGTYFLNNFCF